MSELNRSTKTVELNEVELNLIVEVFQFAFDCGYLDGEELNTHNSFMDFQTKIETVQRD